MRKNSPDNDPPIIRNKKKERNNCTDDLLLADHDACKISSPSTLPSSASEDSSLATLSPDYLYNYNLAKRVDVLRSYKKLQAPA